MSVRLLVVLLFSLLLGACSLKGSDSSTPSGDPHSSSDPTFGQVARGLINGQSWEFHQGRAYVLHRAQEDYLVIRLWDQGSADPCTERVGSTLQARVLAPKEAGSWSIAPEDPFNPNLSIFFTDLQLRPRPRDSMRADQGKVTFYKIAGGMVNGYFQGSYQNPKVGVTQVEGDFEVPICPEPKLRQ